MEDTTTNSNYIEETEVIIYNDYLFKEIFIPQSSQNEQNSNLYDELNYYILSRFIHLFKKQKEQQLDKSMQIIKLSYPVSKEKSLEEQLILHYDGFKYKEENILSVLKSMIQSFNELNQQIFPIFKPGNVSNFFNNYKKAKDLGLPAMVKDITYFKEEGKYIPFLLEEETAEGAEAEGAEAEGAEAEGAEAEAEAVPTEKSKFTALSKYIQIEQLKKHVEAKKLQEKEGTDTAELKSKLKELQTNYQQLKEPEKQIDTIQLHTLLEQISIDEKTFYHIKLILNLILIPFLNSDYKNTQNSLTNKQFNELIDDIKAKLSLLNSFETFEKFKKELLKKLLENPKLLNLLNNIQFYYYLDNDILTINDLLNYSIYNLKDINYELITTTLGEYILQLGIFYYILFNSNYQTDINLFLHNIEFGKADIPNEYSETDYNNLTTHMAELCTSLYGKCYYVDGGGIEYKVDAYKLGWTPHDKSDLIPCLESNITSNISIDDLKNSQFVNDFKNMQYKMYEEEYCNSDYSHIELPETQTIFSLPYFLQLITERNTDDLTSISLLNRLNITNQYLQWYYRPTISGSFGIWDDIVQLNKENSNYYYTIFKTHVQNNSHPHKFSLIYNKLWIQLQYYKSQSNFFIQELKQKLKQELTESINYELKLQHLFPFIFLVKTKLNKKLTPINYTIISVVANHYHTLTLKQPKLVGIINIPFDIDSRNVRTPPINLPYYIFKEQDKKQLVITNHRNRVYPYHQKEVVQTILIELNIIGYLSHWDNPNYSKWTLYPYLAIYTNKYTDFNKLYIDTKTNYKTHIYISSLNYTELKDKQIDLSNNLYINKDAAPGEGNVQENLVSVQLNMPKFDPENDKNISSKELQKNIHLYLIPIIPILMHKMVRFICPKQEEQQKHSDNLRTFQDFIKHCAELKQNSKLELTPDSVSIPDPDPVVTENPFDVLPIFGGGKNLKYFAKYMKYKKKYLDLIYASH